MPAERLAVVFAVADVHRPIDEDGEPQPSAGTKLQHPHAALDPVAERHQPNARELGEHTATFRDLPLREGPTEQLNHSGIPRPRGSKSRETSICWQPYESPQNRLRSPGNHRSVPTDLGGAIEPIRRQRSTGEALGGFARRSLLWTHAGFPKKGTKVNIILAHNTANARERSPH
jgi:hypothetical protein